jgi:hypothetical protein
MRNWMLDVFAGILVLSSFWAVESAQHAGCRPRLRPVKLREDVQLFQGYYQ